MSEDSRRNTMNNWIKYQLQHFNGVLQVEPCTVWQTVAESGTVIIEMKRPQTTAYRIDLKKDEIRDAMELLAAERLLTVQTIKGTDFRLRAIE